MAQDSPRPDRTSDAPPARLPDLAPKAGSGATAPAARPEPATSDAPRRAGSPPEAGAGARSAGLATGATATPPTEPAPLSARPGQSGAPRSPTRQIGVGSCAAPGHHAGTKADAAAAGAAPPAYARTAPTPGGRSAPARRPRRPAAPLTRRTLLAAAAALALAPRSARAQDPAPTPLRIGAVLPIAGPALPAARINLRGVGEAARMGLTLAAEDAGQNGALLGWTPELVLANAPGPEAAARAARRLIAAEGVTVLIGGYTAEEAEALAQVAEDTGALFLNAGASADRLRQSCRPMTFHVEPSAAMYLDALLGWFVRAGFRRWHVVRDDSPESAARADRARAALDSRHWGAKLAGTSQILLDDDRSIAPALADIAATSPDVVLLLTDWRSQLDLLSRYQAAGLTAPVTGFPEPAAQLREFYLKSHEAAPTAGSGRRAAAWEATLDAYGARELNARFNGRWGRPMDPAAWSAYMALKIAFEAAMLSGSTKGPDLAAHLAGETSVFDVSKGIGVTFRPWDHQLRQSLFLVKIADDPSPALSLDAVLARASLEGELPAIYMPGTDPVERLDQLGDLAAPGACPN